MLLFAWYRDLILYSLAIVIFCRYFKPAPRCCINQLTETCTIYLPKSCPIQTVFVQGNTKTLKQLACLETCKQLHKSGALTDNLVPQIVEEEAVVAEDGNYYTQPLFVYMPEMISLKHIFVPPLFL